MDPLSAIRWPIVSEEAIAQVSDLLRSGRTSFDEELCQAFEAAVCRRFDVRHAIATCNGTAALFSACYAAGLGPGDEVLVPPLTHWASVAPAAFLGCDLVYVDVEPDSLSISCEQVRQRITERTRAIIVCHLFGNPVDVAALRSLCDERQLVLIEDVSHATGATLHGRPLGSFGHLAAFSMQAAKLISAGEGGILLTNGAEYYERALELGHPKRPVRLPGRDSTIRVTRGFKFRPSTVTLALALDSLSRLDEVLATRTAMAQTLRSQLADCAGVSFPREITGAQRVYWEYELSLTQADWQPADALRSCAAAGLPAAPWRFEFLPDIPWLAGRTDRHSAWPCAVRHQQSLLVIPPFNQRDDNLLDRYAAALRPPT